MLAFGTLTSVTVLLIALIVAISLYAFQNHRLVDQWMLAPYAIKRGHKYYTLLSSGFIHADFRHLLFNMFTLYFFGMGLENVYELYFGFSGLWIAALFLSGVVVANGVTYFEHQNDAHYRALGASGGVESVVFALILLNPTGEIRMFGAIGLPAFVYAFGYLAYSYYQSKNSADNIGHTAHIAGAAYGLIWQSIATPEAWRHIANLLGLA